MTTWGVAAEIRRWTTPNLVPGWRHGHDRSATSRRAKETVLNQISQNERLATRGDFEELARRNIEDEQRELVELDEQEAALEAELRAALRPDAR